jgi:hypothetical protein
MGKWQELFFFFLAKFFGPLGNVIRESFKAASGGE